MSGGILQRVGGKLLGGMMPNMNMKNNPVANITENTSSIASTMKGINLTTMMLVLAAALFIVAGLAYYYFYVVPTNKATYRANKELKEGTGNPQSPPPINDVEILFFYADWCPHSKKAKPIMDEFEKKYTGKTVNGYTLVFTGIDCSSENAQVEKMMDKYNIEGFPTIKMIKDGKVIEYDAKPHPKTLEKFIQTVLAPPQQQS